MLNEPAGFRRTKHGNSAELVGRLANVRVGNPGDVLEYATAVVHSEDDGAVDIHVQPHVYFRVAPMLVENNHLVVTGSVYRVGAKQWLVVTGVEPDETHRGGTP
jgi:hypothetical protein